MLENIARHMEMGKPRMRARARRREGDRLHDRVDDALARRGVHPRAVHDGGILGRLLHEFAVTIIVAVLISGFVSLTLTPLPRAAACSRCEREQQHGAHLRAPSDVRRDARGVSRAAFVLGARTAEATMAAFSAIFVGTGALFYYMPKGFLPSDDVGQLFIITEAAQDISFDAMANLQRQVAEIVRQNPHVEGAMSFVGAGGPSAHAQQRAHIRDAGCARERPPPTRSSSELRPAVAHTRNQGLRPERPGDPASASSPRARISTRCRTPTPPSCTQWAPRVEEKLQALPGLARRHQRSADHAAAGLGRRSTATGRPRWASPAQSIESTLLRCVRLAAGVDDLCPDQPVLGGDGARAALPDRSVDAGTALRAVEHGRADAASTPWPRSSPRSARWR